MRLGPIASRGRPAYTLLEVLLASAIGVMVMGALYVIVDVQFRHTQSGRTAIEQSTLVRALLTRIGNDISNQAAPVIPPLSSGSGGGSGGGATGAAGGGASPAAGASSSTGAGTTGTGSTSGGSASSSSSSTAQSSTTNTPPFNLGVQGTSNVLILSLTKFPREVNVAVNALTTPVLPLVSDERRISYWLAGDAGSPLGLARQELKQVTSDDANITPPSVPDEASYVIAEEVKSLTFQYFDGTSWQDTWDGTQPGADGSTPMGPPLAIAITLGVAEPGNDAGGQPSLKLYRHVVSIMTANGVTQANLTTSP
jgi:hypothetical protein